MTKVKKGDGEFTINCSDQSCEGCCYVGVLKCTLFDDIIDNVNDGYSNSSGYKRCKQCIDAEIA